MSRNSYFYVCDKSLNELDDASARSKPLADDVMSQDQVNLLRDQVFAFKILAKNGELSEGLKQKVAPSTLKSRLRYGRPLPPSNSQTLIKANGITRVSFSGPDTNLPMGDKPDGRTACPQCGRYFSDMIAHLVTHDANRPEKSSTTEQNDNPSNIPSTAYGDRLRLVRWSGKIICTFCPSYRTAQARTFDRVDAFQRHLKILHGVDIGSGGTATPKPDVSDKDDTPCPSLTCTRKFNSAQQVYDHLENCVIADFNRKSAEEPPRRETHATPTVDNEDGTVGDISLVMAGRFSDRMEYGDENAGTESASNASLPESTDQEQRLLSFGADNDFGVLDFRPPISRVVEMHKGDELRRRDNVDERTTTMKGVKLFVANPDLSDSETDPFSIPAGTTRYMSGLSPVLSTDDFDSDAPKRCPEKKGEEVGPSSQVSDPERLGAGIRSHCQRTSS